MMAGKMLCALSTYRVRPIISDEIARAPQPKLIGINVFPINWGEFIVISSC